MKKQLVLFFIFGALPLMAQHPVNQPGYGPFQQLITGQPATPETSSQQPKSKVIQSVDFKTMDAQVEEIGRKIRNAGCATLGIGLPIAIAGAGCLIYGFAKYKTPLDGYTTNSSEASRYDMRLITMEEYAKKSKAAADVIKKHEDSKTAGYVLFSVGSAMTLVSIPIIVAGNHIMDMNINYMGNGAGIAMRF